VDRASDGLTRIYWIENRADYRSDYTRFSLMEADRHGLLEYAELSRAKAQRMFELSDVDLSLLGPGLSLFLAVTPNDVRRFAVDNADGFIHLSDLLQHVDLYFAGPFLPSLYREQEPPTFYPWQQGDDLSPYETAAEDLAVRLGDHFHKIHPFIPMPFRMWDTRSGPVAVLRRKARRLAQARLYRARYDQVLRLRRLALEFDVVCRDTLWGWKGHRIALHELLRSLETTRRIHAELLDPDRPAADALGRPFEEALASSRLCVLASGKHWGWREVGFLALAVGLPILMDRPLYEPYVSLDEFKVWYTANEWEELPALLDQIGDEEWAAIKAHNQDRFDAHFAPEPVARYLLDTIVGAKGADS
jgi:hypothetical protein